jgi:hypothetical protein
MIAILLYLSTGLFVLAFILTGYRLLIGPTSLDRLVAFDGVSALMQCALAIYIFFTIDTTVVNGMVVVALFGFISSVALTRFRKEDDLKDKL